jgi:hypothetical protein
MLLQTPADLVSHSLSGGAERAFDTPAGRFATVIPGTDILLLSPENGKVGFRQGAGPFREVLQGIKLAGSAAVANDLTLFGGVDTEKRLWIQRGADQPAEVAATGVERVLWGPISHRALVEGPDRKSRVYDVRDRDWIDLGTVVTAAWSPDEERLLFVESYGSSGALLSLLTGRTVTQLCDMRKVGAVAKIAFSDKPDRAFLLAAMDGQFNVFLVALP